MVVGGESFFYSVLFRDYERDAIGETPGFVRAIKVQFNAGLEMALLGRNDLGVRVVLDQGVKREEPVSERGPGKSVGEFAQYPACGQELGSDVLDEIHGALSSGLSAAM